MGSFCSRSKKISPTPVLINEIKETPYNPPRPIRIPKHREFFSLSNRIKRKRNKKLKKKSHTR